MTDIGDDVTVTTTVLVDGVLTDPDTVVITVTDPAGDDTTPSVANPSVGVYQANVPVTAAGRWLYVWVTTNPDSVEHGYFDVLPDPPRLQPLAQISDLEATLGRVLTTTEQTRAVAYLARASALIRRYTGQVFDAVADDVVILRPVGAFLVLPQTPVTAVTEVRGVDQDGAPGDPLSGWTWDGLDRIDITTVGFGWVGDPWWPWPSGPESFRVVYDHGGAPIPDDVIGVCCDIVLRTVLSPSQVEGFNTERIGQYSYGFQQGGGGSPGVSLRLTEADKDALSAYRPKAGSVQVRL